MSKEKLPNNWDEKVKERCRTFMEYYLANGNNYFQMTKELGTTTQTIQYCLSEKMDSKLVTWKGITKFADWYDETIMYIEATNYETVEDYFSLGKELILLACKTDKDKEWVNKLYKNRENMFRWCFEV